jgi:hypothetical protein
MVLLRMMRRGRCGWLSLELISDLLSILLSGTAASALAGDAAEDWRAVGVR